MAIEIVPIARDTAVFLTPFLPYLVKFGEKAAEKAAEKFPEASWNLASKLWKHLNPKLEEKEASKEATEDLANAPEDEDALAAFRLQLRKLLDGDETLAAEVQDILTEIKAQPESASYLMQVTGSGNVSVQGQGNITSVSASRDEPDA